jgi:hypothetical protein
MQPTLTVLLALCIASSSLPRKCQRPIDQLYRYASRPAITDEILEAATGIAMLLPEKCISDELVVEDQGKKFSVGSATRLFCRICRKSTSQSAVESFVRYRVLNWESADEEFSLSVERVFVSKPEAMLRYIRTQPDTIRTQLLNDIVWGFLSNRVYGPVDPFEERGRHSLKPGEPMPQEVLNKKNYKQIFFNLHPGMRSLWDKYAWEYDVILTKVGKYLETWGVEY